MARSMQADFLQNMRFHVTAVMAGGGPDPLQPGGDDGTGSRRPDAGFSTCSMPELQTEEVTYTEGNMIYEVKQPGRPTMGGALTVARGVARQDSSFYRLARLTAEGAGEYRMDLQIKMYHRSLSLLGTGTESVNFTQIDVRTAVPAKTVTVFNAFCSRCKPGSDLDATSSDISVAEMDFSYESFT